MFFTLLLVLPGRPAAATTVLGPGLHQAYREILKLKADAGQALVEAELRARPANLAALLLANYTDMLQQVSSQNPATYAATMQAQEARLQKIRRSREQSPYRLYAQAEIRIHQALCQFLFDDELKAVWNIRQAFMLLEQNQRLYPDFYPNRKSLGLLQFALGSVPDSYHWVLSLLGMKADVKTGIRNLKAAADHPHFFQAEAQMLYHFLDDMLHREEQGPLAFFLHQARSQPDNLLACFMAVSILQKRKHCDEALAFFRKRPQGPAYLPLDFMHHMAADMYLFRGDYRRSLAENNLFLSRYRGLHYVKDAYHKMYLAALLQGQTAKAKQYLDLVQQKGSDFVEEDVLAQRASQTTPHLNLHLMKARLHTDGGYYPQAEEALAAFAQKQGHPTKDKIEYYYRKARVYHGLQQLDKAREYYLKTLEMAGSLPYYFAPNAALQLGYMALGNKEKGQARFYFKKALAYPNHEYKRSIDSKAKVALGAL
ncbi:MAG: DUF3808 domain-containing protein [Adhaeribacter sp.]